MKTVKEVVKKLKIFERNKAPLEIKIIGVTNVISKEDSKNTFRNSFRFSQCSSQVGEEV
ncbi:MAG: hypothetical protein J7K36_04785 [Archaeoglobaceae archaeon]|nr:hypothetical protein [Archaeoglobaceae archaeon]